MKKWNAEQIVKARKTTLKPVLEQLGYRLKFLAHDNWEVIEIPGEIIVRDHYWRSRDLDACGNAIDLLTNHFDYSFTAAMDLLLSQHK